MTPALYVTDAGGVASRVCTFDPSPTYAGSSVTSLVSVTADGIVFQAAYPTPADRTLFRADMTAGSCGVPVPVPIPSSAAQRALRGVGEDPSPRVWTSMVANPAGTHGILSTQSPDSPPTVYLVDLAASQALVSPWSPLRLLSNGALAAMASQLPIPTRTSITIPSALPGVNLYGVMYRPATFSPEQQHPALIYVYGGPGSQTATSTYPVAGTTNRFLLWMASQGYVVVTVDGRGTGARCGIVCVCSRKPVVCVPHRTSACAEA